MATQLEKVLAMLKNYFKTAIRNLRRNRAFALINILGLVLGISGTIVIYRIVTFEKSFDTYHSNADSVYRVNFIQNADGDMQRGMSVMHPLREALRTDFPDWIVAGIHWYGPGIFMVENDQGVQQKFREEEGMAFVEPGFFDLFDYEVIAGNPDDLLTAPKTMGLSATAADKLFGLEGSGYQSILGKTISFENKLTMTVQMVYQDPPKNTDFGLDYVMFYEGAKIYPYAAGLKAWATMNGDTRLWVRLPTGQTEEQAEDLLRGASKNYLANLGIQDDNIYLALEPLAGIHLDEETGPGGLMSKTTLNGLQIVALIMVLTAAINFVNLATAQSVKRAKEIGIRKVLGSHKSHLVIQFLGEVFLITTASVVLSLGLSEAALIKLEPILGYDLGLNLLAEPGLILFLLILIVVVTFLAGFYPAVVLANYNPVHAIKNSSLNRSDSSSMSVRRLLVVFQFFISQVLIIGTLVIVFQMDFIQKKELGFDTEAILTFSIPERTPEKMELLKSRVAAVPGVGEVSFYIASPGGATTNNIDDIKDPQNSEESFNANRKNVDHNYANLFDLELLAGEFYRDGAPKDQTVINRKFAEQMGYTSPEQALGQRIETKWGGKYLVAGVVEDFHNKPLRSGMEPVYMMSGPSQYFEGGVKLRIDDGYKQAIAQIEKIWSEVFTADVFTYQFLDERIAQQYESEKQISGVLQVFAGVAIFIGCLGLYGLVSFMANQKVKEIGIRKVLGSSVMGIVNIFSREVLILLGIAFLLAGPVGYYFMKTFYLDNYVYSISIGVPVFLVAIVATVIIAASTVGLRAFRAASANPIQSLRDD